MFGLIFIIVIVGWMLKNCRVCWGWWYLLCSFVLVEWCLLVVVLVIVLVCMVSIGDDNKFVSNNNVDLCMGFFFCCDYVVSLI